MSGPPPKRSDKRLGNHTPAGPPVQKAMGAAVVKVPRASPSWHPLMKDWFRSLKESGQAQFYQSSDWQTARLLAEIMSYELSSGEGVKASMLGEFNRAAASLMTTEGERRRLRLELQNPAGSGDADDDATVSIMEHYRDKLS